MSSTILKVVNAVDLITPI